MKKMFPSTPLETSDVSLYSIKANMFVPCINNTVRYMHLRRAIRVKNLSS